MPKAPKPRSAIDGLTESLRKDLERVQKDTTVPQRIKDSLAQVKLPKV